MMVFSCLLHAQPVITSISPVSGSIGSTVTITGSSFGSTPASNIVYFGATRATVSAASATSLSVVVPTGASYEPVTVTTGGLTAASSQPFNVTFPDPGQFTANTFSTQAPVPTGDQPYFVLGKDMDGDGKPDLTMIKGQVVSVYANTGTPGFPNFTSAFYDLPKPADGPATLAVGDVDGDGKADIAISFANSSDIYIYLNTSTPGIFSFAAPTILSSPAYITNTTIADIDGDGKPEIIAANADFYGMSLYKNISSIGSLGFDAPVNYNFPDQSGDYHLVAADLDNDGMTDIAISKATNNIISLYRNTGVRNGAFSLTPGADISTGDITPDQVYPYPYSLAAGDLDGDGKLDLVVDNQGFTQLFLMRNTSTAGNISFLPETSLPATGANPGYLTINDLDGDGLPDIIVAPQVGSSINVFKNTSTAGHIAVADAVNYTTGPLPYGIAATDFDGDGMPDIATVNEGSNDISILINKKSTDIYITSFTPTTGGPGTVVTITGDNFANITDVKFGGTSVGAGNFTVVSPTTITATVGSGSSGPVTVLTAANFAAKNGFTFTIQPPTITSFNPQSGGTGTSIQIIGTGFLQNAANAVSFGGTPAQSFTVVSDTEISAVVGNGSSGDVSVSTPSQTVNSSGFTYNAVVPVGPPVITSFSPMSAMESTNITINGSNLSNITGVSFGGTPAQSFRIGSDNVVYATVAAGSTGTVEVTSGSGNGTFPGFTFLQAPPPTAPPTITDFSPKTGKSGTKITITGTNLSTVTAVTFGGTLASSINAISDTQLEAIVNTGSSGVVKVASPIGADSLGGFTYQQDTQQSTPPAGDLQLIQFSGTIVNNQPHLSWQVRNDGAISFYAVERSIDGSQFTVVGTVPLSTKTGTSHTYSFSDFSPKPGTNYYRIKMQDTATHYVYSSTIALQLAGSTPLMMIYPNPVKYGFFYVDLPNSTRSSRFQLTDLNGRVFQNLSVDAGVQQIRINIPGLPRGSYQLRWTNGTQTASQTILVL